jgi:subtilisin family serine protease
MLRIVQCAALALVVASALGGVSVAAPKKHPKRPAVPGELLVGFKAGVSEAEQDDALAEAGASGKKNFKRIKARLATTQPERVEAALKALEDDPRVRYAEPNYVVSADLFPTDPSFAQLWGLQNTGQSVNGTPGKADADIDAPEAWDVTTGSSGVVVAVVDTGVDFSHPDLGGSMTTSRLMWTNPGEMCAGCSANGVDDDGDGYVDDWRGWDFVNHDANPQDDNGHGSHVSGTIGALGNNGIGVTGVAWGGVRIMALKFLDASGYGSTDDAVSAILYAADHGAQILSNSWGGDAYTQALKDAIAAADSKGALFVAARRQRRAQHRRDAALPVLL